MDTTLLIKRALVWGGSFAVGLVIALVIVYGPLDADLETYSYEYFVVTWLPISFIFLIWGDVLLGTKILKD